MKNFHSLVVRFSVYLNKRVFVMKHCPSSLPMSLSLADKRENGTINLMYLNWLKCILLN